MGEKCPAHRPCSRGTGLAEVLLGRGEVIHGGSVFLAGDRLL